MPPPSRLPPGGLCAQSNWPRTPSRVEGGGAHWEASVAFRPVGGQGPAPSAHPARAMTAAALDTFPKLLLHHAARRGGRPANREKDYGIWQSWSWAEVEREVAALACGLASLGFRRGDKLAIIGDNRPRLYWAMTAAQALGG